MHAPVKRFARQGFDHVREKLRGLGASDIETDAVLSRIHTSTGFLRSEDIVAPGESSKQFTVLMAGIACLYERLPDGSRQIFAFQYPGDFCDLNRHLLPEANNEVAVAAISACSVGTIRHSDLDALITQYPSLATTLWRASTLEANMLRQRLLYIGRRPALQRVAHLICEQLARREAVGIRSSIVGLSQLDLADATGLSIVHVNRTFKQLQNLGLLAKEGRTMKVVEREKLAHLAAFAGDYLNMPQLLSDWATKMEPHGVAKKP